MPAPTRRFFITDVHASKGFVRLGRTLCPSPGSEYADRIRRGTIVNLEGGRVKEFTFIKGRSQPSSTETQDPNFIVALQRADGAEE